MNDRYGSDVLSGDWRAPKRGRSREVPAERDVVVEGEAGHAVRLEPHHGGEVLAGGALEIGGVVVAGEGVLLAP